MSRESTTRGRVVIYRALGLGDFLTAVPAYRALAAAFRGHEVCLAAPEALRGLAGLTGAIDTLLPTRPLEPPPWDGPAPALGVNLHGRGPQSSRALLDLRPERVIAFASEEAAVDGPVWRADEHEVHRWCRLLRESGIAVNGNDLDLSVPDEPAVVAGATVVHPGAASPVRRWPAERFAAVARALEADGHHVVVTGGPAERDLAAAVTVSAGLPRERDLSGRLDLTQLAAVVAAARLLVCGDTGVGHLATAYRTPSVLLFGPVSPSLWGPPPDRPWHRVIWPGSA